MEGAIDLIYLNRYIYYTFLFNAKKVGVCPPIATLQEKKHPTQIKKVTSEVRLITEFFEN